MEIIAKFCPCNFEGELDEVKDQVGNLPNVEIVDDRCLNYCGQCLIQPYALINGENIVADTADELLEKILNHISVPAHM